MFLHRRTSPATGSGHTLARKALRHSRKDQTAVHAQGDTCDIGRLVGCKEAHRIGDIFRGTGSGKRNQSSKLIPEIGSDLLRLVLILFSPEVIAGIPVFWAAISCFVRTLVAPGATLLIRIP